MSFGSFFFFFKQKTAYEISVRDWSSDVCSSDLGTAKGLAADGLAPSIARPRPVTLHDVASADHIVSFGCDLGPWLRGAQKVERWDVPAISDGYGAARDAIVARLEDLCVRLSSA